MENVLLSFIIIIGRRWSENMAVARCTHTRFMCIIYNNNVRVRRLKSAHEDIPTRLSVKVNRFHTDESTAETFCHPLDEHLYTCCSPSP